MVSRRALLALSGGLCFCLVLLSLVVGFVPREEGPELRRLASQTVRSLAGEDVAYIESQGDGERQWALRRAVLLLEKKDEPECREQRTPCVDFSSANVVLVLGDERYSFGCKTSDDLILVPLLTLDGFTVPSLVAAQPLLSGEALDSSGAPLRWYIERTLQAGYTPFSLRRPPLAEEPSGPKAVEGSERVQQSGALPAHFVRASGKGLARAQAFQNLVQVFSRRHGLDPSLVNAIIYSESAFNTGLVSKRSAVGLMQVLPSTAGRDIHRFLHGSTITVSSDQLFDPATNIQYGTAYLRILRDRYFGQVTDHLSREYCMIAAYNMGPKRVVRLFGDNPEQAAQSINALTSEEVYQALVSRLPRQETRTYVAKVRSLKQQYAHLGGTR